MSHPIKPRNELSEFLLYTTPHGDVKVEVSVHDENIRLSQKRMAELFAVDTDTIGYHLKNIYESGELSKLSTTESFSVVQKEGDREVKREIEFYNLNAVGGFKL